MEERDAAAVVAVDAAGVDGARLLVGPRRLLPALELPRRIAEVVPGRLGVGGAAELRRGAREERQRAGGIPRAEQIAAFLEQLHRIALGLAPRGGRRGRGGALLGGPVEMEQCRL